MRDVLTFKVKRPKKRRTTKKKYNDIDRKMVYITRIIARGDYDPEKKYHSILARIARSRGIIDAENNIIK